MALGDRLATPVKPEELKVGDVLEYDDYPVRMRMVRVEQVRKDGRVRVRSVEKQPTYPPGRSSYNGDKPTMRFLYYDADPRDLYRPQSYKLPQEQMQTHIEEDAANEDDTIPI